MAASHKTKVVQRGESGDDPEKTPATSNLANGHLVAWFTTWRGPMRKWLSSRGAVRSADIDDIAQEVFVRLLRYSDDTIVNNPQGYLYTLASHVASEWNERSRNRRPHDDSWLEELQIEHSKEPENVVSRALSNARIRAAVDRLPPRQRELLLLHVNDGLTYKQIAHKCQLTYRVVLRDLTRAYSQLRMRLSPEDFKGQPDR